MNRSHPLWQLTLSRVRMFFREPSAVFWSFGFPLLMTVVLGIAFRTRPPEAVRVAIVDGPGAARAAAALEGSKEVVAQVLPSKEAHDALRTSRVALLVEPGTPRTYVFDPMRQDSRLARALTDEALQRAEGRTDVSAVRDEQVTEPGGRYVDFLVPGLIGMNLMSAGMWGIGYLIVEMRTRKLLKRLAATPMKRSHFLLSFILMRMLFLVLELPVPLLFAWLVFDVKVRGSIALVFGVATLGAMAFAGIGLLVASRAQNTQTVGGLMNLVMFPMFLCSGVFFSSANFPDALQPFIKLLPLTALIDALRAIINDGAGLAAVAPPVALLALFAAASFGGALKLFRWQ